MVATNSWPIMGCGGDLIPNRLRIVSLANPPRLPIRVLGEPNEVDEWTCTVLRRV
jgi:hypothetical protein